MIMALATRLVSEYARYGVGPTPIIAREAGFRMKPQRTSAEFWQTYFPQIREMGPVTY